MSVFTVLSDLASNNSRNFKISYLKNCANDELVKRVFAMALDPMLVFYIKKIPAFTSSDKPNLELNEALTMLYDLSDRTVTGNNAIKHLWTILCNLSKDDAEVVKRIISKDLRCGTSTATAATVWPEFSKFIFPLMLASAFDQKLIDKLHWPAYVQQKLDGVKFSAIVDGEGVVFLTRSGNIIDIPNDDLYKSFVKLGRYYDFPVVFDGEMLVVGDNEQVLDRQTGNGVIGKAVKGTMSAEEAKTVRTVIWDVVPSMDFRQGRYNVAYQTRLDTLYVAHATLGIVSLELCRYVSIVPTAVVNNFEEAEQIFNDYIDLGYEGVIIKNMNMPWENKRSKHQVKMKAENDLEAEVVGWIPGTGKNQGLMGALECKSGDIEFRVGTGFSEMDREQFTDDYIVGKIITVTYNQVVSDKTTGTKSLFLPRFNCVRFDKNSI